MEREAKPLTPLQKAENALPVFAKMFLSFERAVANPELTEDQRYTAYASMETTWQHAKPAEKQAIQQFKQFEAQYRVHFPQPTVIHDVQDYDRGTHL